MTNEVKVPAKKGLMGLSRRTLMKGGAATVAATTIFKPAILRAADNVIKIGHVSPQTGPMAGFAEAQDWTLNGIKKAFEPGVKIGDKTYKIEIIKCRRPSARLSSPRIWT